MPCLPIQVTFAFAPAFFDTHQISLMQSDLGTDEKTPFFFGTLARCRLSWASGDPAPESVSLYFYLYAVCRQFEASASRAWRRRLFVYNVACLRLSFSTWLPPWLASASFR